MNPAPSRGIRDLWLPLLVICAGTSLFALIWAGILQERRLLARQTAEEFATGTRNLVGERVRAQFTSLVELARLWQLQGQRPIGEWRADVDMLMDNLPALTQLAWLQRDGRSLRIHPEGATPNLVQGVATPVHSPVLSGPERGPVGEYSFRLLLPVGPAGAEGALAARFDLDILLERLLRAESTHYALRVNWAGEPVFTSREAADAPDWYTVSGEIALPYDVVWRMTHAPTPELAAVVLRPTPHYLLAAGIVLSFALAALLQQLRVTRNQARFLVLTNRALETRSDELEQRVDERTRELADALSELQTFNQSVSHDLRSPLGAILNFSSLLEADFRDRPLDDEGMDFLAHIRRSALRATRQLEDLLALSSAGSVAMKFEFVDMSALAREIFAQVCAAEDDEVEFVVDDLPSAFADRPLIASVFSNLLTNALKYSRGCEKRRVTVRGSREKGLVTYEIADSGRGFDMRFGHKLFEVFERLHTDEEIEGTGIGLAIVERIVRRHDGKVWAEGEPGAGARFFFSLPDRSGAKP